MDKMANLKLLTLCALCYLIKAEYLFNAGDNNGYADHGIYMSDGDMGYQEHWPMDSAMYPGQGNAPGAAGMHNYPKCIDIPSNLTLCQNLRYQQMRLPNLLEHDTIREVTQQAGSWVPLVGIRCHPDTKLFLCSLFSPVCLDRPIWPCRSLCFAVKNACEGHMNAHGYSWPDMLRCDKFPLDNDLCIGLQNDKKPDEKVCEPCNKPMTFESIIHHYCINDFVLKAKIEENVIVEGKTRITASRKKKLFKSGKWSRSELRQPVMYMENGERCDCPALDDPRNTNAAYLMMGKVINGKHMVDYVQIYDKKSKVIRKAFRKIRQGHVCEDGVKALTTEEVKEQIKPAEKKEREEPETSRGNNRKNRRRKDRGQGKRENKKEKDSNDKKDSEKKRNRNRKSDKNNKARRRNRDTVIRSPLF